MTGGSCRDIRPALGVYVLGAIDPAERAQVDSHLAACPDCREELAGLAGLPALLRRVPFGEAQRLAGEETGTDPAAGDSVLPALLARVAAARRARQWRFGAAAVAVIAVAVGGGVVAGALGAHGGTPAARPASSATSEPAGGPSSAAWRTATGGGHQPAVRLTVRYAPTAWGTAMKVQVTGIAPGTVCRLQVIDAAGRNWTAGSWRVPAGAWSAWYPASSSLPYDQVRGFAVVAGHTVLARAALG